MPVQKTKLPFNTFVGGLITEASPLTYPPNATLDEQNFVLNRDGSRQRRLGMDYEDNYSLIDTGRDLNTSKDAISTYKWEGVAQDPTLTFTVIQVGNSLWFFDTNNESISSSLIFGPSQCNGFDIVYSFASVLGKLVVATGFDSLAIYTYDPDTKSFSQRRQRIEVRDVWGVDDGLPIDQRVSDVSTFVDYTEQYTERRYNNKNAGWDAGRIQAMRNGDPAGYPSRVDIPWFGKHPSPAQDGREIWSDKQYGQEFLGTTPAPIGKFVLDVFNRGLSRRAADSSQFENNIPYDKTFGGISSVIEYGGRLFYGITTNGIQETDSKSPDLGSMIFFSQVIDNEAKIGYCYTEADPTSEEISDPVDTDGGFITLPEMKQVLNFAIQGRSLIVVATNGVWEINGQDEPFSATNISINYIGDVEGSGKQTVLSNEGLVSMWSKAGIYVLSRDQVSLEGGLENITESTIQTKFLEIPSTSLITTTSTYDSPARQLRWMYDEDSSLPSEYFANTELVYDIVLQAFYPATYGVVDTENGPYIADYVETTGVKRGVTTTTVTDNGVTVTDDGEDLTVVVSERTSIPTELKYLTFVKTGNTHKFTFSERRDNTFVDWKTYDGVGINADAYMITGYLTGGESTTDKSTPYIYVQCAITEDGFVELEDGSLDLDNQSSCLVQAQWEWANSANSGRWGKQFQAYRLKRNYIPNNVNDQFDYGFSVMTSKSKLRGKGRTLSLRFDTEAGKDLILYGWTLNTLVETD